MAKNKKHNLKHLSGDWTIAEIAISYKPKRIDTVAITSTDAMHKLIMRLLDNEKFSNFHS